MDCWSDVNTPAEHVATSKWILDTFLPLEGERCRDIELTDNNGILAGRFPPHRHRLARVDVRALCKVLAAP